MVKVMVVDDHQLVIDGIFLMLRDVPDLECIAKAGNGKEMLTLLAEQTPDVILMDINMPEMDGLEACKAVKESFPSIKIVALSMLKEMSMIKKMIQNGAEGYLLKNAGKDEVIDAIRKVVQGEKYYSEEVVKALMNGLAGQKQVSKYSPFPKISRREKQILQLIVDEYTTGEIAEKLFISFGTVETHRRNLLLKLDARNTAGLVRAALEYNLLED